jgi:hypothetical protein
MLLSTLKNYEGQLVQVFIVDGTSKIGILDAVIDQYKEIRLSSYTDIERGIFKTLALMTSTIVGIREYCPKE